MSVSASSKIQGCVASSQFLMVHVGISNSTQVSEEAGYP